MNTSANSPTERPFEIVEGEAAAGVLFICDHASNAIAPELAGLGLSQRDLSRHIAYDIGAAEVTRALAGLFGAPAVLSRFSRLVIDPNRGADDPTLAMRISDGAIIPGNATIDEAEIERRREAYWRPYREAVGGAIAEMIAHGPVPGVVSIHSFTPTWRGAARPWQAAALWDRDPRIAQPVIAALRAAGMTVGDTLYDLATKQGLAHVLIEVRQDLVGAAEGAQAMAETIAQALRPVLADPDTHIVRHYGSRAGLRHTGHRP